MVMDRGRVETDRPRVTPFAEIAFMYNVSKRRRAVPCSYSGETANSLWFSNTFKFFVGATSKNNILPWIFYLLHDRSLWGLNKNNLRICGTVFGIGAENSDNVPDAFKGGKKQ